MNSQTTGSSVPPVGSHAITENGDEYEVIEGNVATGDKDMLDFKFGEDARIKCNKCTIVTAHKSAQTASFGDMGNPIQMLRVLCCTVCGTLSTKR